MGLQFLIVDDHPLMCGAIRNNLEMLGDAVRCEPAATLAVALRGSSEPIRCARATSGARKSSANATYRRICLGLREHDRTQVDHARGCPAWHIFPEHDKAIAQ